LGKLGGNVRLSACLVSDTALRPVDAPPPTALGWVGRVLVRMGFTPRWLVILPPALWMTVFLLIPLAVVFKISFSEAVVARPPYLPLLTFGDDGEVQVTLHLSNYLFLFQDNLYIAAYLSSLKIAFISTVLALLIGYPIAYFIARSPERWRNILLMLVILPFWSSFLLRVYAWIGFLKNNGVINNFLGLFGIPQITMLYTDFGVYVGIVYTYLPFMILPLYTTLVKLDGALLEASADLGARPFRTFLSVTLPLSLPGIIAGSMLVFIPAIGEYVIPTLLGSPNTLMIGRVLWDEFFSNRDWPLAASVAIAMLVVVVVPLMLLQNAQSALVERGK
jgi:putrescine transport system permease protein